MTYSRVGSATPAEFQAASLRRGADDSVESVAGASGVGSRADGGRQTLNAQASSSDVAARAGLGHLATPVVKALSKDAAALQTAVMEQLSHLVEERGLETQYAVFRLCSLELLFNDDGSPTLFGSEPIDELAGLKDGFDLIEDDVELQNAISASVYNTLLESGQMDYLTKHSAELMNEGLGVVIDVDFYYRRSPEAVGFHKDTIGRSLFVNLNFNNEKEIMGPEYVLNPPAIPEHDAHIDSKLPVFFKRQLLEQRQTLPTPTEISATRVPPNGMVSWVDEMVHHTTPYLEHRGITLTQLNDLIKKMRPKVYAAIELMSLVEASGVNSEKEISTDYLRNIGLDDKTINALCAGGSNVKIGEVRSKAEYGEIIDLAYNYVKMYELFSNKKAHVQRDDFRGAGYNEQTIHAIFGGLGKPDLSRVEMAACEDNCHVDANAKQYEIALPRLQRRMSEILANGELPAPTNQKRQFIRTWVQVLPMNPDADAPQ